MCLIGERIINSGVYKHGSCNESTFEEIYCPRNEDYELLNPMDPDCHYFQNNPVQYVAGIPGLSSGVVTGRSCPRATAEIENRDTPTPPPPPHSPTGLMSFT